MIAQQLSQDYYLFFDREKDELGKCLRNYLIGEEIIDDRPAMIENALRDVNGRLLNRQVRMIHQENKSEVGMEARITGEGNLEVLFGGRAFEYFSIDNEMTIPLPAGDGVVRIKYNQMPLFDFIN